MATITAVVTDDGLECLIDYHLPLDVMDLCFFEIRRRRDERLAVPTNP